MLCTSIREAVGQREMLPSGWKVHWKSTFTLIAFVCRTNLDKLIGNGMSEKHNFTKYILQRERET